MTLTEGIGHMEMVNFSGQECVPLENGLLKLLVTRSVGPRIISLSLRGGENLFAVLPDFVTECPGVGPFHFYGGHRLWDAPESLDRTYLPDDRPVEISSLPDGLAVTQPVEPRTGLQKSLEIVMQPGEPRLTVTHHLTNHGLWPVTCAPWAITQLRTGGVALLPQITEDTGVLPNRALALWPYSDVGSRNVTWGHGLILVQAIMQAPIKLGFPNPRGWLGYWLDGILFVKHAPYDQQGSYVDFGSSSEFYCNAQFLELETIAPLGSIPPGGSAAHVETWELYADIDRPRSMSEAQALVAKLGLG